MEKVEKLSNMRHTLAHLLAASVGEIYKFDKIKLTLGPAIENGFYYDIDFCEEKITDANLKKIEDVMKKKLPINRSAVPNMNHLFSFSLRNNKANIAI